MTLRRTQILFGRAFYLGRKFILEGILFGRKIYLGVPFIWEGFMNNKDIWGLGDAPSYDNCSALQPFINCQGALNRSDICERISDILVV